MKFDAKIKTLQQRLNSLWYDPGPADGFWGKKTEAALKEFQANNGLKADGIYGPKSAAKLASANPKKGLKGPLPDRAPATPVASPGKAALQWPRQIDCQQFYGAPGNPRCTAGKAKLPIPFRIAWDLDQKVNQFSCHELVAAPMTAIFAEAVAHYGEAEFRKLGLDLFGGCYNLRKMRGGSSYSMHSWGIAVDLDPERNQLQWGAKATKTTKAAEFAKPAYEPFWQIVESKGALSLGRARDFDWMHFQFARL